MTILLALAAVALLYWALKNGYLGMDKAQTMQLVRTMGGYALVGLAITLVSTGKVVMAVPAAVAGLWLMGLLKIKGLEKWTGTPGGASGIVDIGIDPATGAVTGRVVAGPLAGRTLDSLDRADSLALVRVLAANDPNALRLFAIHLDRRFPGWREDLQGGADAGTGNKARPGVMTHEEAQKILGLGPGADEAAIREAHRRLILKLHPDVGGSDALAAMVNEAKDVLLRRHR